MSVTCPNCKRETEAESFGLQTCQHCEQVIDVAPPKPQAPAQPEKRKVQIEDGAGICGECGEMSVPVNHTPGNILIEIALWLFFLIPGLIYSIWRWTTRRLACRHCGGKMFTLTSPKGRAMLKQYHNI